MLVPAKDANALAGAMRDVMRVSNEQRAAMGRAARTRVLEEFNMDARANEWEEFYGSTLDYNSPKPAMIP